MRAVREYDSAAAGFCGRCSRNSPIGKKPRLKAMWKRLRGLLKQVLRGMADLV